MAFRFVEPNTPAKTTIKELLDKSMDTRLNLTSRYLHMINIDYYASKTAKYFFPTYIKLYYPEFNNILSCMVVENVYLCDTSITNSSELDNMFYLIMDTKQDNYEQFIKYAKRILGTQIVEIYPVTTYCVGEVNSDIIATHNDYECIVISYLNNDKIDIDTGLVDIAGSFTYHFLKSHYSLMFPYAQIANKFKHKHLNDHPLLFHNHEYRFLEAALYEPLLNKKIEQLGIDTNIIPKDSLQIISRLQEHDVYFDSNNYLNYSYYDISNEGPELNDDFLKLLNEDAGIETVVRERTSNPYICLFKDHD